MGELLSYATLVSEKVHVRISGQDVQRGTFTHRHAVWVDQVKEQKYFPLSHVSPEQAPFDIFNSPLSEYAVLGFDFGYSFAYPKSLVDLGGAIRRFCQWRANHHRPIHRLF